MKAYIVLFDWSTDDGEGVDIDIFDTYEKAVARFMEIIENEKNPKLSWVGDYAFDENGNLDEKNYELDTNIDYDDKLELYWNLNCKFDWYQHDFLDLKVMEIK